MRQSVGCLIRFSICCLNEDPHDNCAAGRRVWRQDGRAACGRHEAAGASLGHLPFSLGHVLIMLICSQKVCQLCASVLSVVVMRWRMRLPWPYAYCASLQSHGLAVLFKHA